MFDIRKYLKNPLVLILLFNIILLYFSFFRLSTVGGQGMEPAMKNKSKFVYRKFLTDTPALNRSELIVYTDSSGFTHIGRIIALPREAVRIENDSIYIDTRDTTKYKLSEEYLYPSIKTTSSTSGWVDVQSGSYFVLKDNNRQNVSIPSNIVKRGNIKGTIVKVL